MANLDFIRRCAARGRVFWSYHANMRLGERMLGSAGVLESVQCCEIIEDYPADFPLPSCLCLAQDADGNSLHYVVAEDSVGDNIRFVTVYRPDQAKWSVDFRTRVE